MNRPIAKRRASIAAACVLAMAAMGAGAQTSAPAAQAAPMSLQQAVERVTAQGYKDVREVERKGDKLIEIEARDGQGRRVELLLDARSGEILREKVK